MTAKARASWAIALTMGVLVAIPVSEAAPKTKGLKSNRIEIKYVEPKSPDHQPVYRLLKERQALEKFKSLLSPLKLPRSLLLQTAGCDGVSNAWYDGESVTVCYEYLDDIWKAASEVPTSAGIAPVDTIVGPLADVFFHEVGHAVFDILQIPLFGREEDAADQFSTYIMLKFPKDDARRLILGAAYQYKADVSASTVTMARQKFADEHGTPVQRFYNLLCMAYGADVKLFADFVEKGFLPKDRSEGCESEYAQVTYAMETLIGPYIDRKLARKRQKQWLPPATVKPKKWRSSAISGPEIRPGFERGWPSA